MPNLLTFSTPPIEEDLAWIDTQGKVNLDSLIAAVGLPDGVSVKDIKQDLRRSPALLLIKNTIAKRYQASQTQITPIADASWPYRVAYLEGYRKALREIYQTIPSKTKDP